MQLRDIEYVVEIAKRGNFSKAAQTLYVSQPALSQSIQRLETELGITLFIRRKNSIILTDAGELFVDEGKKILEIQKRIYGQMADVQSLKKGSLEIGMTSLFCRYYFSKIFCVFKELYPNIVLTILELSSAALEKELVSRKIELAIFPLPLESDALEYEHLITEEVLLAVPKSHPINKRFLELEEGMFNTVELSEFKDDNFIMLFSDQRLRTLADIHCRKNGFEPKIVFETRMADTVNALVEAGMGIGFLPKRNYECLARHGAIYYHIAGEPFTRVLVAAYRRGGYVSNISKEFVRVAKEALME